VVVQLKLVEEGQGQQNIDCRTGPRWCAEAVVLVVASLLAKPAFLRVRVLLHGEGGPRRTFGPVVEHLVQVYYHHTQQRPPDKGQ